MPVTACGDHMATTAACGDQTSDNSAPESTVNKGAAATTTAATTTATTTTTAATTATTTTTTAATTTATTTTTAATTAAATTTTTATATSAATTTTAATTTAATTTTTAGTATTATTATTINTTATTTGTTINTTATTTATTATPAPVPDPVPHHHAAKHIPVVPVPAGRLHTLTVGPAPHSDVVLHTCACAERTGGAAVEETQPMTSKTQTFRQQQQQQLGRRAERTLFGLDGLQPEKPPAGAGKREQAPLTLLQQQQSAKRSKKLGQWEQLKAGALARLEWLCLQLYPKRAGAAQGTGSDRGGAQQPLPRRGEDDEGAAGSERQEDTVV
ncbi:uncharacterized protein DDB_G0290587-like [Lethenteron reissneri]|uniref:uncharacterized protein DDB_G0290587-like n=1 Tax=Lethenteron reissneri TaxID=7753 RepID=UPI002AB63835|nr:uncharacterized protein DDB_G0290587-like [Lethenteron reissneri]XP_061433131.1 uncharacterized protein DDB_G0290587-like [Lethenteron reissneri]